MRRKLLWVIFVCYAVVLVRVVLLKYHIFVSLEGTYMERLAERVAQGNYTPFSTIAIYAAGLPTWRIALPNLFGNILIFVPLGILLPLLRRSTASLKKIALLGFGLSFAFECLQLVFIIGTFDVDDLILNTLGTIIGYACLKIVRRFIKSF